MSGLQHIEDRVKNAFVSGEPGTTGREPFENSSASGPGQQFSSTGGVGGATGTGVGSGLTGQHGTHGHDHSSHHHTTGDNYSSSAAGGTGLTGSHSNTTGTGLHSHSHDHDHNKHGLGGGGLTGAAGGAAAAVGSGTGHRDHHDRVGAVGQDSSKYEGDLNRGPVTSGAAGTDKFDSDRARTNAGHGDVTGHQADRQYADGAHQDTSQRAPGQSSGGLSGILATSDKDFTGRDRKGEGAYADTDGKFELNSTGPAGNTALTGREGNLNNNPVAQQGGLTRGDENTRGSATGSTGHSTSSTSATGEPHKEGLVEKVKHAVGL